jgi:hypothetical protein
VEQEAMTDKDRLVEGLRTVLQRREADVKLAVIDTRDTTHMNRLNGAPEYSGPQLVERARKHAARIIAACDEWDATFEQLSALSSTGI